MLAYYRNGYTIQPMSDMASVERDGQMPTPRDISASYGDGGMGAGRQVAVQSDSFLINTNRMTRRVSQSTSTGAEQSRRSHRPYRGTAPRVGASAS